MIFLEHLRPHTNQRSCYMPSNNEYYVITGATGNIGSKTAHQLLSQGKKVRVIGRSADKLKPFVDKGADAFVGDVENADQMTKAFTGAKAVFAIASKPLFFNRIWTKVKTKISPNSA
jgi:nucleoside-diphosphate-sugar epimerase